MLFGPGKVQPHAVVVGEALGADAALCGPQLARQQQPVELGSVEALADRGVESTHTQVANNNRTPKGKQAQRVGSVYRRRL